MIRRAASGVMNDPQNNRKYVIVEFELDALEVKQAFADYLLKRNSTAKIKTVLFKSSLNNVVLGCEIDLGNFT
jgi:hypothetical protein